MLSKDEHINITEVFKVSGIIPVAVFSDIHRAVRTAGLLRSYSINVLEITLRTPDAFDCIKEVRRMYPDMCVGAGSVLSVDALKKAVNCGAMFGVSPSLDMAVVDAAKEAAVPFVPGIATPSELLMSLNAGCTVIKIFPAVELGGVPYIKAVTAPFKMMDFHLIPTGGVDEKNFTAFMAADRVIACGASYPVHSTLVDTEKFDELEKRIAHIKELCNSLQ
ncbi:MAG TPA: bifunctional 4-hydroxy-2-oxoglutarate aldolase/2-dehydro-3-deoxy-phosphogluconate aldolase [Spirochaetota bacterium]|nr:bifunctional 4-hydroxy-2-oxoglutarate aldolase/2-dehydro-3-deoxy-phosphogluconate aldolase [Spirochaetota bacterium]